MSTIYEVLNNTQIEPCVKQLNTLTASDASSGDYFGKSVSVFGNRLAVGATAEDTAGTDTGKVYVYEWNRLTKTYDEIAQVLANDPQSSDFFGFSVALYENRLVVGALYEDTAGVDSGKVYVYDWNDQTNTYDIVTTVIASDAEASDTFGYSVSLDGKRLVVGAANEDTATTNAGKVYVYDWDDLNTEYVEIQQLFASDSLPGDSFGTSVSVYGDKLVVGSELRDSTDAGKVYVYEWNFNTNSYVEISQLTASDAEVGDYFGSSVSLSGNRLVVGSRREDTAEIDAGKVYIYEWDSGTKQYIEKIKITALDAESGDHYGSGVSVFDNRLVIGSQYKYISGLITGKVYVYDICTVLKKINTTQDQTNETNIDWLQNGERAGDLNLNRPVKQVSDVVNNVIEHLANLNQVTYEDIEEVFAKKDEVDSVFAKKDESDARYLRSDANSTLSSTLKVTGSLIYEKDSSMGFIPMPGGGQYYVNTATVTGAIKISLPTIHRRDMMSFWVDIYDYAIRETISIFISGYAYEETNAWINCGATIFTTLNEKDFNIRFGLDEVNNCVWIGETNTNWAYPQITIRDVQLGFSSDIDQYDDNWSISIVTSFDTITTTLTGNLPASSTAKTLATSRNISLSGDVTGSASFNGSSDIVINASVNPSITNATYTLATGLRSVNGFSYWSSGTYTWNGEGGPASTSDELSQIPTELTSVATHAHIKDVFIDISFFNDITAGSIGYITSNTTFLVVLEAYYDGAWNDFAVAWRPKNMYSGQSTSYLNIGEQTGTSRVTPLVKNTNGRWGKIKPMVVKLPINNGLQFRMKLYTVATNSSIFRYKLLHSNNWYNIFTGNNPADSFPWYGQPQLISGSANASSAYKYDFFNPYYWYHGAFVSGTSGIDPNYFEYLGVVGEPQTVYNLGKVGCSAYYYIDYDLVKYTNA